MNHTPRISLFIIAKNEAHRIAPCILSAKGIVSEIVVVDACSSDNTAQICKELGAQVYEREFDGFASQKNFALSKVTGQWALNLDADERLSPALQKEILTAVRNDNIAGYYLPFCNYFLGKKMRFSGLNKERHLRLVRTHKSKYIGGLVHEGLEVDGPLSTLKNPVNHFSYDTIEDYFTKFNKYTSLAARQLHKNGRKFCLVRVLLTLPFEFFKRYVFKLGFLDGIRGLLWAGFSTYYVSVKYAKLWQLEQQDK
ncbi:MAG: glycosyltransferase family 2 protein [Elusimicrobiaceae bacterium]|nr:glycosyltransferase family 2 protein [Elusimicrobiaceae bacterium]